jgi:DNA-binding CsgD family transcriptional regulator
MQRKSYGRKERYIVGMAKTLYVIDYLGRYCKICGFDGFKRPWFMDFHHRNPKTKEYCVKNLVMHGNFEKFKPEIDKCDLICNKCHRDMQARVDLFTEHEVEIFKKLDYLKTNGGRFVNERPFTKKEVSIIRRMVRQGKTRKEISKFLSKPYDSVRAKILGLGLNRECRKTIPSGINVLSATRMFKKGMSLRSIGGKLGVSYMTVGNHLRKNGTISKGIDLRHEAVIRENKRRKQFRKIHEAAGD